MKFREPKSRGKNPETEIYEKLKEHLEYKGWFVQNIHGNMFQNGLPDVFCSHPRYPNRWVELKTPARARERHGGLSDNQMDKFKLMHDHGVGIWVLAKVVDWTLLCGPPNWLKYATGGSKIVRPKGF